MKIEVTPLTGYSEVYTVTLAGQYRLTFAGTKDNATQVANTLRKGINRSGRTKKIVKVLTSDGGIG